MSQNTIERNSLGAEVEVVTDFSSPQIPKDQIDINSERRLNSSRIAANTSPSSAFLDANPQFESKAVIAPNQAPQVRNVPVEIQTPIQVHSVQSEPTPVKAEERGFWGGLWDGITSTYDTVCNAVKNLPTVVKSIVKAVPVVLEACKDGIVWMCNNPGKVLTGLKLAGEFIVEGAKNVAISIYNDPIGALGKVWEFGKNLSEGLGFTDILRGGRALIEGLGYTVMGDFDKAGESFKKSLLAVKGAFTGFCEFTGLADAGRCIMALARNNPQEALLYAGLAAYGIAGIFLSAGAANAAKVGTQLIAKEFGQQILKEGAERVTRGVLLETGEKNAKESLETLGKKWSFNLTEKTVFKVESQTSHKAVEKMLKETGMPEVLEHAADKFLQGVSKASRHELAGEIRELGVKQLGEKLSQLGLKEFADDLKHLGVKELTQELKKFGFKKLPKELEQYVIDDAKAKYIAKSMKKLLKDPEKLHMFKNALVSRWTHDLKEDLLSRGLKEGFKDPFEKGMKELCDNRGFSQTKTDRLIKAGNEGFEYGVGTGVRKVVREAVENAFKKFLDSHKIMTKIVEAVKNLRPSLVASRAHEELKAKEESESERRRLARAKRDVRVKVVNDQGEEKMVDQEENSMV